MTISTVDWAARTTSPAPLLALLMIGACTSAGPGSSDDDEPVAQGDVPSWEEFRKQAAFTYEGRDSFVVEGDLPLADEAALADYYYSRYWAETSKSAVGLVGGSGPSAGDDDKWTNGEQLILEYCVDNNFGGSGNTSKAIIEAWAERAVQVWSQVANVAFKYVPAAGDNGIGGGNKCDGTTPAIAPAIPVPHERFFKITNRSLDAVACTFQGPVKWVDPGPPGGQLFRNKCDFNDEYTLSITVGLVDGVIDENDPDDYDYDGQLVMIHEFGHILGLAHEYQRSDAAYSSCAGAASMRALSPASGADALSVMNAQGVVPVCGTFSPAATPTPDDGVGLRMLYGAPPRWFPAYSFLLL